MLDIGGTTVPLFHSPPCPAVSRPPAIRLTGWSTARLGLARFCVLSVRAGCLSLRLEETHCWPTDGEHCSLQSCRPVTSTRGVASSRAGKRRGHVKSSARKLNGSSSRRFFFFFSIACAMLRAVSLLDEQPVEQSTKDTSNGGSVPTFAGKE